MSHWKNHHDLLRRKSRGVIFRLLVLALVFVWCVFQSEEYFWGVAGVAAILFIKTALLLSDFRAMIRRVEKRMKRDEE